MRQWLLYLILPAVGYVVGALRIQHQSSGDLARNDEMWQNKIAEIRQRVYELDLNQPSTTFDPAKSSGLIVLSYVGGFGVADRALELHGDGKLKAEIGGEVRLLRTLPREQCSDFFRNVLSSGIFGCSAEVIELKRDLLLPQNWKGVTDHPTTRIRISAPGMRPKLDISVYAPEVELDNFPDIIELKIITRLQDDLLGLVPKNDLFWK